MTPIQKLIEETIEEGGKIELKDPEQAKDWWRNVLLSIAQKTAEAVRVEKKSERADEVVPNTYSLIIDAYNNKQANRQIGRNEGREQAIDDVKRWLNKQRLDGYYPLPAIIGDLLSFLETLKEKEK